MLFFPLFYLNCFLFTAAISDFNSTVGDNSINQLPIVTTLRSAENFVKTNSSNSTSLNRSQSVPIGVPSLLPIDDEKSRRNDTSTTEELIDDDKNVLNSKIANALKSTSELVNEASSIFKEEVAIATNGTRKSKNGQYDEATAIWIGYGNALRKLLDGSIRQLMPAVLERGSSLNITQTCTTSLLKAAQALKQQKKWIFRMMDASGRPLPSGYLDGTLTDFGSFDECLAITYNGGDEGSFAGQYCVVKYSLPLPKKPKRLTLQSRVFNFTGTSLEGTFIEDLSQTAHVFYYRKGRIGLCVPSACNRDDIQKIISNGLNETRLIANVSHCNTQTPPKLDAMHYVIIAIFAAIAIIVILSTCVDLVLTNTSHESVTLSRTSIISVEQSPSLKLILAFSLYRNGQELFDTRCPPGGIEAIHGIRIISMAWILWTHTYLVPIKETFTMARNFIYAIEELPFQLVLNGWVLVDSFFCIGAILAAYTQLKVIDKFNGEINIVGMVLGRIIRVVPSLWFTLMLFYLLSALGSGPLWDEYFDYEIEKCKHYWWSTALLMNNWLPETKMCLLHSWYLAADFQLYILGLFLLPPLFRWPKIGITLAILVIVGSEFAVGVRTYVTGSPPTVVYNTPDERKVGEQVASIYTPTYSHLGPYFVGILAGYALFRQRKWHMNGFLALTLWCIACVGSLAILLSTYDLNNGNTWSPFSSALYASMHRTCWAIVVVWVVIACWSGHGGPINVFLSWSFFKPLSKLSFMIYLIHYVILWVRYASLRERLMFSHWQMSCEFIINFVLSTLAAIVAHLCIEAPAMKIYKKFALTRFDCFAVKISKPAESIIPRKIHINPSVRDYIDDIRL